MNTNTTLPPLMNPPKIDPCAGFYAKTRVVTLLGLFDGKPKMLKVRTATAVRHMDDAFFVQQIQQAEDLDGEWQGAPEAKLLWVVDEKGGVH